MAAQEEEKRENKKRTRRSKFDKKKGAEAVETPLAVTEEVHTAETVLKPNEEIKPVISEELIDAKSIQAEAENTEKAESREQDVVQPEEEEKAPASQQAETSVEQASEKEASTEAGEEAVKEEKPKRTRRPNRGTSKRTRAKKAVSEEKVEE